MIVKNIVKYIKIIQFAIIYQINNYMYYSSLCHDLMEFYILRNINNVLTNSINFIIDNEIL